MTADVRRTPRRGTSSRIRHKAYARATRTSLRVIRDASFTRSFDPCTSILTTHRSASCGGGATGRHHGWANPRKREEPSLGSVRTDVARLAAHHRFSQGKLRGESRKGRRSRSPSLRGSRARVELLARRCMLQKSVGDVWPRISSANALQKERSGSSERGPSVERKSAGDTVGRRPPRNARRESSSPLRRARIGARLRVARDRHPAVHPSSKAVCGSWDRGCKGHRILGRVPIDGRHSGSSRGVGLHGTASTVVSADSAPSDPYEPTKRRTYGQVAAPAKAGEARG
jgi:hypothetical protein